LAAGLSHTNATSDVVRDAVAQEVVLQNRS
jgi:hypothetical protein